MPPQVGREPLLSFCLTVRVIFPIDGRTLLPSITFLKYPVPASVLISLLLKDVPPRSIVIAAPASIQAVPRSSSAYQASAVALVLSQLWVCLFFNNQVLSSSA